MTGAITARSFSSFPNCQASARWRFRKCCQARASEDLSRSDRRGRVWKGDLGRLPDCVSRILSHDGHLSLTGSGLFMAGRRALTPLTHRKKASPNFSRSARIDRKVPPSPSSSRHRMSLLHVAQMSLSDDPANSLTIRRPPRPMSSQVGKAHFIEPMLLQGTHAMPEGPKLDLRREARRLPPADRGVFG